MEKSMELVFVPAPGVMTHLVSSMEFAKLLVRRDHRIHITVLIIKPPELAADQYRYTKSVSASEPRIKFVDLPRLPLDISAWSPETFMTLAIESHVPSVRGALAQMLSDSARVAGLILDIFCVSMIDAADEFDLPSYIFVTSNAAFLSLNLYLPTRHGEFSDSDAELPIPGFANSVPPLVLPPVLFNDGGYQVCLRFARRYRDSKGIIVNSFAELEPYAFSCFSNGQNHNPPVYAVGPVVDLKARANPVADHDKLIKWLDDQPPASVVFLCFGTAGGFDAPQTEEIAVALERSGYRFLWTIREPSPATEVLPEGFMERIGGKGMICRWSPQVEVLAHKAIGGFVSHCGWNSVLESLWNQVPIATWPLYAEQRLNAFVMVKELGGLAVEMSTNGGGDLVSADEIESALRRLMDGDGEVRKKVKEMGTVAKEALMDGGSSFTSIGRLIADMIGKK